MTTLIINNTRVILEIARSIILAEELRLHLREELGRIMRLGALIELHWHHEWIELELRVRLLSILHHGLLQALQTLVLHDKCYLVVDKAMQLTQLLSVADVCQLFDVFLPREIGRISSVLLFLQYRLELHTSDPRCLPSG